MDERFMLLISGAVCTFIDYEYITLLFPYPGLINIIDYLSQMLICEFLLIYLSTFLNKKSHIKTANVMIFLWTLCIVGYCLFQKGRGSDAFLSPAWVEESMVMKQQPDQSSSLQDIWGFSCFLETLCKDGFYPP